MHKPIKIVIIILIFGLRLGQCYSQNIEYNAKTGKSNILLTCNNDKIKITEDGKVTQLTQVDEMRYLYYMIHPIGAETDVGSSFIRVVNCENNEKWGLAIANFDALFSNNETHLVTVYNEVFPIANQPILKIYDIFSGSLVKVDTLSLSRGQKVRSILTVGDQTYFLISRNLGEIVNVKKMDHRGFAFLEIEPDAPGYYELHKDTKSKYAFLLDRRGNVVKFLSEQPCHDIEYKTRDGKIKVIKKNQ